MLGKKTKHVTQAISHFELAYSFEEIENTMLATFAAVESAETGLQKKIS